MDIITIGIFLVICLGLGFLGLCLAKPRNFFEELLLAFPIGLAMFPFVILLLRLLHLPIDFRIIGAIALIGPVLVLFKRKESKEKLSIERATILAIVFIAALLFTSFMYVGATKYPYLENDDPWEHAAGARYIAIEKTTEQPERFARYLEPYPPYFTAIMGVLHQTSGDLQWILKFFNALIIGISIIAAFFLFEALTKNQVVAASGAVVLGAIPGYMSHFIWSQTLAVPVFLIALWALVELQHVVKLTKKPLLKQVTTIAKQTDFWLVVLLIWSATIIQPSVAGIGALLFIIYGLIQLCTYKRDGLVQVAAIILGGVGSACTFAVFAVLYGWERFAKTLFVSAGIFTGAENDTSGGVVYSLSDFLFPAMSSKIDQATGIGWFIILLALITIVSAVLQHKKVLTKKNTGLLFAIILFVVAIFGVQGNALPIKLFPHRFWIFLAIPAALLAAQGAHIIGKSLLKKQLQYLIFIIVVTGLMVMSVSAAREAVQHAQWPPGVSWKTQQQLATYVDISKDGPVSAYPICSGSYHMIGFNNAGFPWSDAEKEIKEEGINVTPFALHTFLQTQGYTQGFIDSSCIVLYGQNETNAFLQEIGASGMYRFEERPGYIIFTPI